jgi:integrase
MFQIRIPAAAGGRGLRPIRIGLGVLSKAEAREIADRLAAVARMKFRELAKSMAGKETNSIDDDEQQALLLAQLTIMMKSTLFDIRNPPPEPAVEEARGLAFMKDVVGYAQQLSAKQQGLPYQPLIADNAQALAMIRHQKYEKEMRDGKAPEPQLFASPSPPPVTASEPRTEQPEPNAAAAQVPAGTMTKTIETASIASRNASGRIQVDRTPAYEQDRKSVVRPASTKPLFRQIAGEYLSERYKSKTEKAKDVQTAEMRLNMFVELIGDHPIDTYTAADLQAFVHLMGKWPAKEKERPAGMSTIDIIRWNAELQVVPLAKKTLENGYVAVVKSVFGSRTSTYDYVNPMGGARLRYPDSARETVSAEPLGADKISRLFEVGVKSGFIDGAMLPLIGLMTGRRLGLLVHLRGSDIREKYDGVAVAQVTDLIHIGGRWKTVPVKTRDSVKFFVLHSFLNEIGFVDWAQTIGDEFIFPQLMKTADPAKTASQYMGRLYSRAGIKATRGEVFHSLRGGFIAEGRDQDVRDRDLRLQAGHDAGEDEHSKYGFNHITEKSAHYIANLPLNPRIDFSMFKGLDFNAMWKKQRTMGRAKGSKKA